MKYETSQALSAINFQSIHPLLQKPEILLVNAHTHFIKQRVNTRNTHQVFNEGSSISEITGCNLFRALHPRSKIDAFAAKKVASECKANGCHENRNTAPKGEDAVAVLKERQEQPTVLRPDSVEVFQSAKPEAGADAVPKLR